MTTVAYRSGILAADTQLSYTTIKNGSKAKIAKVGEYLVALAGPTWLRKALERWVSLGADEDAVPDELVENESNFAALVVDRHGQVFEYDHGQLLPIDAEYASIGSGGPLALGAMAHGATAEEAVVAACKHDKNSGGPVQTVHFSILG